MKTLKRCCETLLGQLERGDKSCCELEASALEFLCWNSAASGVFSRLIIAISTVAIDRSEREYPAKLPFTVGNGYELHLIMRS